MIKLTIILKKCLNEIYFGIKIPLHSALWFDLTTKLINEHQIRFKIIYDAVILENKDSVHWARKSNEFVANRPTDLVVTEI